MKNRKRRIEVFSFYDHVGMERHLEKMAARGWLPEKISGSIWTYRRAEPEKRSFAVTYDPGASPFAPGPTEEQLAFREFCRYDGWEFAAARGNMQVFYNREENPTPLETDEEIRTDKLRRAAKRSYIPGWLALLLLSIWHVIIHCIQLGQDAQWFLGENSWLLFTVVWGMLALLSAGELAGYWFHKSATRWKRGCVWTLTFGILCWLLSFPWALPRMDWVTGTAELLWLGLLPILAWGLNALLKRRKGSAKVNGVVTLVGTAVLGIVLGVGALHGVSYLEWNGAFDPNLELYTYEGEAHFVWEKGETLRAWHDELPLTVEDLVGMPMEGYSYRMEERNTLFLRLYDADQLPREDTERFWNPPDPLYSSSNLGKPNLSYTIVEPKISFLYEVFNQQEWELYGSFDPDILRARYVSVDPAPWGAEKVYELRLPEEFEGSHNWLYLLCYENRIVTISLDWEPTQAHKAIVAEKLGR